MEKRRRRTDWKYSCLDHRSYTAIENHGREQRPTLHTEYSLVWLIFRTLPAGLDHVRTCRIPLSLFQSCLKLIPCFFPHSESLHSPPTHTKGSETDLVTSYLSRRQQWKELPLAGCLHYKLTKSSCLPVLRREQGGHCPYLCPGYPWWFFEVVTSPPSCNLEWNISVLSSRKDKSQLYRLFTMYQVHLQVPYIREVV